jgi:hypothetical protein
MRINANIVGFDTEGNPISSVEFINDVNLTLQLIKEDRLETFTPEEVRRKILYRENS